MTTNTSIAQANVSSTEKMNVAIVASGS